MHPGHGRAFLMTAAAQHPVAGLQHAVPDSAAGSGEASFWGGRAADVLASDLLPGNARGSRVMGQPPYARIRKFLNQTSQAWFCSAIAEALFAFNS